MPDTPHLLIALAASHAPGCQQALQTLQLPHLSRLLARLAPAGSDPGQDTAPDMPHQRALARHLGLPGTRTPWAAWQRQLAQGDAGDAAWAFVTPCQWLVGADHVTMAAPARLHLTDAESRVLLEIVAPWFAEDGITLHYHRPTLWMAQGAAFDGLACAALERVVQRDVRAWLPDAAQARTLHRLHSEMQMLLYTHPFNDLRSAHGRPPVNAFWVHGAGRLAAAPAPVAPPEMPTELLDCALREDWPAWADAWRRLDAGPVARLAEQAARGQNVRLTLCGERGAVSLEPRRGLAQKIQGVLRPQRFTQLCDQL